MITVTQIRNGERYFSRHLTANDYYSEGESVTGYWQGEGAAKLRLQGDVTLEQFEALRCNRHPETGEKLTPRKPKVAYHDIVISAPKPFSVAAMVGEDERLLSAFRESVAVTFGKLEGLAAVRLRSGSNVRGEGYLTTGNATCATFIHDTSRLLDPQVHAHLVFANVSYSKYSDQWLALQPKVMMEATKHSIRDEFYRDLAARVQALGYEIQWRENGFGIAGITREMEWRFSRRSIQRLEFEERYRVLFGSSASKERIEQFIKEGKSAATARFRSEYTDRFGRAPAREEVTDFVRDYRSASMKSSTRAEVRGLQRGMLSESDLLKLHEVVHAAKNRFAAAHSQRELALQENIEAPGSQGEEKRSLNLVRPLSTQGGSTRRKQSELDAPCREMTVTKAALSRSTAIRRMKRGQDISRALKGYPMGIIAKQIRRHASRF